MHFKKTGLGAYLRTKQLLCSGIFFQLMIPTRLLPKVSVCISKVGKKILETLHCNGENVVFNFKTTISQKSVTQNAMAQNLYPINGSVWSGLLCSTNNDNFEVSHANCNGTKIITHSLLMSKKKHAINGFLELLMI